MKEFFDLEVVVDDFFVLELWGEVRWKKVIRKFLRSQVFFGLHTDARTDERINVEGFLECGSDELIEILMIFLHICRVLNEILLKFRSKAIF